MSDRPLKLAALDAEDLAVISAHVQDAVAKVGDVRWLPAGGHFVMPMNRFAWERTAARSRREPDERRRAVLQFDRVRSVRATGITPSDSDAVVSVLALLFHPTDPPGGVVTIVCSGGASFRLDVEVVEARLSDLGAAWSAGMRPKHGIR
jgi:hypothetical protein